jgi:hypothetical protein
MADNNETNPKYITKKSIAKRKKISQTPSIEIVIA